MANEEHLAILKQGVKTWNEWRKANPDTRPDFSAAWFNGATLTEANLSGADLTAAHLSGKDLSGANLRRANLSGADLSEADLSGANFVEATLTKATLSGADLSKATLIAANLRRAKLVEVTLTKADLSGADLSGAELFAANLRRANLSGANLSGANLVEANLFAATLTKADLSAATLERADFSAADLSGADLSGADLQEARLVRTILSRATLSCANVYGVSAWSLDLSEVEDQTNLRITPEDEPEITVDNLEVAQFVYLLWHNEKIRDVIDTITSKVVLILGRFTNERLSVLQGIRQELRNHNLTPVLFDFDKPASKDVTGTVETLARMARFIIADLTDPSSIPHELATVIPFLRTTAVLPIRLAGSGGFTLFADMKAYPWVLEVHEYQDSRSLIDSIEVVIAPAEELARQLRKDRDH